MILLSFTSIAAVTLTISDCSLLFILNLTAPVRSSGPTGQADERR
jgi:hypothetical protein